MAGLSEDEIASYKREFNSFDADGDGTISAEELSEVLRSMGDEVTEEEVRKVINTFDIDKNGTIEFNEFLIMMAQKEACKLDGEMKSRGSTKRQRNMQTLIKKAFAKRAQIRKTFESFDRDGNGFISKKELRLAMGKQGRKLTKQQVDKLMKETDSDGDGQISYEEFFKSMVKNT